MKTLCCVFCSSRLKIVRPLSHNVVKRFLSNHNAKIVVFSLETKTLRFLRLRLETETEGNLRGNQQFRLVCHELSTDIKTQTLTVFPTPVPTYGRAKKWGNRHRINNSAFLQFRMEEGAMAND